jgi:excisionase family DNA binding protein
LVGGEESETWWHDEKVPALPFSEQPNHTPPPTPPTPPTPTAQEDHHSPTTPEVSLKPPIAGASEVVAPADPSAVVNAGGGSVVRLELFLSPEQVHQMLRGIFHGAHSVMTLREAAQYLRVNAKSLLDLASAGEIPAFMVDGAWKFPRHAIDEWITLQTITDHPSTEGE